MIRVLAIVLMCAALAACATATETASLPPPPAPGEPPGIAGMAAGALRADFGPPQFVRKEGQVQLWRYDGDACKAYFFLYPQSGTLAVRHVETDPRGGTMAADASCLERLRARARAVS